MFLTTEPSLFGQKYHVMRVIHAMGVFYTHSFFSNLSKNANDLDSIIETALHELEGAAVNLGADGVIGVHHTTSVAGVAGELGHTLIVVTVMGTAIKFY